MLHISCNADSICIRSSMSNFTASQSFSHTWRAMKTASCSDRSDSSRAVFSRPRCTPRPAAEVQSRHRFCREILFAYHVTVAFARNEKRVSVAYVTRTRAYDGRYEKGRQSHTFSGLPAVLCLFGQVSVTPLPLCRLFAFVGNRSGRLFRHLFSLAGLGRFLGWLFEAGEVRGEIHSVADSLCSGMDCLLEITV